jgi:predicted flap endonuclease-1-like 5' DNA nuclease
MLTTIVIALISFAIAFVAGGVLSKAYYSTQAQREGRADESQIDESELMFDESRVDSANSATTSIDRKSHQSLINEQRLRYRQRLLALNKVISRHEEAQAKIKRKLLEIQQSQGAKAAALTEAQAQVANLRMEIDELKARGPERDVPSHELETLKTTSSAAQEQLDSTQNALTLLQIERDELTARLARRAADNRVDTVPARETVTSDRTEAEMSLRADLGQMREHLATRDRQVHDLKLELTDNQTQVKTLASELHAWKHRVSPLTRKLTQQRDVIRQLRITAAIVTSTAEQRRPINELIDDLKEIRGIGPALERRLHLKGIRRFEQLAQLNDHQLADIGEKIAVPASTMQRDQWIEQARSLAARRTASN